MSGRIRPGAVAVASAVLPGSGQVINRQPAKGAGWFLLAVLVVVSEVVTGHYLIGPEGYSPRANGGWIVHGLWGLVTLGTQPRAMTLAGLSEGDHSIALLAQGLIAAFGLLLCAAVWWWGVRDALTVARSLRDGQAPQSSRQWVRDTLNGTTAYVMLVPSVLLLFFVSVLPIVFGVLIGFTSYDRNHTPPAELVSWVGLENFGKVLAVGTWARTFFGVLTWSVSWAVLATATTYLFGFLQALLINARGVLFPKMWRSIFILPWAVPAMVSALVFRSMFNGQFGPVSRFLVDIGLTDERVNWFTDASQPHLARAVALLLNLWLGFPYFMALISGTLTNIDKSLYEAADIDGAKPWQAHRYITLPIVYRATAPLVLMSLVSNFNNFGVIYFLTEGGPASSAYTYAGSTDLLITWLYKLTLDNRMYNIGSVMSLFIFVIVGTFSTWSLRRNAMTEGAER
ncbi:MULTISPECIES: sugar ABC transporter permease [unclassified Actinomyces]|uniref:carbohydrate ABC transporter permease n=1 Tax=unclassified Actinomyces TaxID=2609248 RepID=UPI002017727B|nr:MULTISPECIES: sugar ABC transporter permease [unclassified Actinomyces]